MFFRFLLSLILVTALGNFSTEFLPSACAQVETAFDKPRRTEVKFELIMPRVRTNGLVGQEWAQVFRNLDVPVRIRQMVPGDDTGIEQDTLGTTRYVTATGLIDRSGKIVFGEKSFKLTDATELSEWIKELETFGAQGAPEGKPLWGLKKAEFDELHKLMKEEVRTQTRDLQLTEAIVALELPKEYPIEFSTNSKKILGPVDSIPPVKNNLEGLAKGTALAMLLREYGLVVAPRRQPDESISLLIQTVEENEKPWPIGWDPKSLDLSRLRLAQELFVAQSVVVEQKSMNEMLAQLEEATDIPVYVDGLALASEQLDFDKVQVTYPRKRTSWSLCLRTLVAKLQLTQELRVDENNRPFLWITKFQAPGAREKQGQ